MKKQYSVLTALMLCGTMMCIPVHADDQTVQLWNCGTASTEAFRQMETVNTHGLFQQNDTDLICVLNGQGEWKHLGQVYEVMPKLNTLQFHIRKDVDAVQALPEIYAVIDKYVPGFSDAALATDTAEAEPGSCIQCGNIEFMREMNDASYFAYSLRFGSIPENAAEISEGIRHGLAEKGIISEFYDFGQTAQYQEIQFDYFDPLCYSGTYRETMDDVQTFLAAYSSKCVVAEETDGTHNYAFHIAVPEDMLWTERIRLAGELYEKYGIKPNAVILESVSPDSLIGHNAMERPGDTNLDCKVDILDVIAANKHILGVGMLDKTGLKNADMDGNGTADSADSLAILKAALEIAD